MRALTESERLALLEVASILEVDPRMLAAEIEFESGWNPQAKNPLSSARGLIQFMNATARRMGYASSLDLVTQHPTAEAQLRGPVLAYLQPMAPFGDVAPCLPGQSLFLAVFYPRCRHAHPDRKFPGPVLASNPGIVTPRDYVEHVWRRAGAIPCLTRATAPA